MDEEVDEAIKSAKSARDDVAEMMEFLDETFPEDKGPPRSVDHRQYGRERGD